MTFFIRPCLTWIIATDTERPFPYAPFRTRLRASLRQDFLLFASSTTFAQVKIVQSNDDGWAVANIRAQHDALVAAGYNVVLSAPADNRSGTGSLDAEPKPLGADGCQFESCPPFSPATGSDAGNPRLNYVNSFPVTAVRLGIQTTAQQFFDGTGPDLVVSGPNVGDNIGIAVLGSGTVGAAAEAAKEGYPSVAFSGRGGAQVSFTTLSEPSASTTTANVFAALGVKFVQALLSKPFNSSSPILPKNILLNVNYRGATGECTDPDAFSFVLTRVFPAIFLTPPDVTTCGSNRLPTESNILGRDGCFASVSVVNAVTKLDVGRTTQEVVLNRLGDFLSCA